MHIGKICQGKLGRLINCSVYTTTTDFLNFTLLEFCQEVGGKIGNFPDIGSEQ